MMIHDNNLEWDGLLSLAGREPVNDKTFCFSLEIPVRGYFKDLAEDVLAPIADIFYLQRISERVYGEPDEVRMVSKMMTLKYFECNVDRIQKAFDNLRGAGIEIDAVDGECMTIYTPYSAYNGDKALRRAWGIVNWAEDIIRVIGLYPNAFPGDDFSCITDISKPISVKKEFGTLVSSPSVVGYRMFHMTLFIDEIKAFVDLVNNIVEMANSDTPTVTGKDLLRGDNLWPLIESRCKPSYDE